MDRAPPFATALVRGGHIHSLAGGEPRLRSLALNRERVLAAGIQADSVNSLAGPDTLTVDLESLCILPGLSDAHVHQIEAGQDLETVDLAGARSLEDLVGLLRAEVSRTPAGQWIVGRRAWHEIRLAERRLPTTEDLDRVSTSHPVMVRRGTHLAVLNNAALVLAGDRAERDSQGRLTGQLRGAAQILSLLPDHAPAGIEARAAMLARICSLHASHGLVGVRDAGVTEEDVGVYGRLEAAGRLTVRTDAMMRIPVELDQTGKLAHLNDLGPPPPQRSDWLRVSGIKLYADGRIEDAAMRYPYLGRGDDRGSLHMDAAEIEAVAGRAVSLGWRVGIHTVGDRALDAVLDGSEGVLRQHQGLAPGWLTVEHALLADADQRRRAAGLRLGVTVQHPLLDSYAGSMIEHWGRDRAEAASPVRGWLAAGALVAGGSDGHVTPFEPLRAVSGLATRNTLDSGVLGEEEAVPLETALWLYTVGGSWLTGWRTPRTAFAEGTFADLVVFSDCLLSSSPEDLASHSGPLLTVVGGRATHDPTGLWPSGPDG